MSAARVVLVRHGRTEWNRTRFLGRNDLPLDHVGTQQALAVADGVAALTLPEGPVVLWSSPLQRATATIAPLAERLGLSVNIHPDLVELDCGAWEGRRKSEVGLKISKLPAAERVPGGESAQDVDCRLDRFIADAGLTTVSGTAVVVGHHLVNKVLYAKLNRRPLQGALESGDYRPRPGSVRVLDRLGSAWVPRATESITS